MCTVHVYASRHIASIACSILTVTPSLINLVDSCGGVPPKVKGFQSDVRFGSPSGLGALCRALANDLRTGLALGALKWHHGLVEFGWANLRLRLNAPHLTTSPCRCLGLESLGATVRMIQQSPNHQNHQNDQLRVV